MIKFISQHVPLRDRYLNKWKFEAAMTLYNYEQCLPCNNLASTSFNNKRGIECRHTSRLCVPIGTPMNNASLVTISYTTFKSDIFKGALPFPRPQLLHFSTTLQMVTLCGCPVIFGQTILRKSFKMLKKYISRTAWKSSS